MAREVLARHDVSAPVRTERWSPWEEEWLDVTDKPSADVAAEQQAEHEYRQEQERERSVTAGRPAWQVRVELPSHRDVVALAGHLAAQGWRVRRRRRHLLVGADCEDDAKGLVRELSGDGRADADTAFRVGRVSYSYMLFDAHPTQVTGGGGPLVRNLSSPSRANSQVVAPHHRLRPNLVLRQATDGERPLLLARVQSCIVVSMVSRRPVRMFSDLACDPIYRKLATIMKANPRRTAGRGRRVPRCGRRR